MFGEIKVKIDIECVCVCVCILEPKRHGKNETKNWSPKKNGSKCRKKTKCVYLKSMKIIFISIQ